MRHPKNHRYAKKNRWGRKVHKARRHTECDVKGAIIIVIVTVILIAAFLTIQTAEFNDCIKYGTGC